MLALCSRNRDGMKPDDLLCSRNARPQKALVGRAQWKINQPPSLKRNGRWTHFVMASIQVMAYNLTNERASRNEQKTSH